MRIDGTRLWKLVHWDLMAAIDGMVSGDRIGERSSSGRCGGVTRVGIEVINVMVKRVGGCGGMPHRGWCCGRDFVKDQEVDPGSFFGLVSRLGSERRCKQMRDRSEACI